MAVSEQRVLPAEFIEAGGKTFLDMLSKAVGKYGSADLSKIFGPQFVAGQDPLQLQAQQLACLLYTSPSPRDGLLSRMPSSA